MIQSVHRSVNTSTRPNVDKMVRQLFQMHIPELVLCSQGPGKTVCVLGGGGRQGIHFEHICTHACNILLFLEFRHQ